MFKFVIAAVVAAVFASFAYAAAAGINFTDSPEGGNVGAGAGTVEGFDVSNVQWSIDTNGDTDAVSFDISPTPSEVQVHTDATGDTFSNWTCTAGANTSCTAGSPVATDQVTELTIAAGS